MRGGKQADLGPWAGQPARPDVRGEEMLIEITARVFPHRNVGSHFEPQPLAQRLLVLAAAPHRQAESGLGAEIPLAREGQPSEHGVDVDDLALGGGVEVACPGQ